MELAWRGVGRIMVSFRSDQSKMLQKWKKVFIITNIRGVVLYKYEVQVHTQVDKGHHV